MATGNNVRFAYVRTGSSIPGYPDADTIYFLEEAKEIRVGNVLFANVETDAVDMDTLMSILEAYTVKNVEVTGVGNTVEDVTFNASTGKITVTKGMLPVLSKGVPTTPTPTVVIGDDGIFEVVADTSVNDHTITDGKIKYKLPNLVKNIEVTNTGSVLNFRLFFLDGTSTVVQYDGLGSAAFADASDFATAAQGAAAEGAMQADGGVATNAHVTLAEDPVGLMDAATKQYVDTAVEGAISNLNFLGSSTTEVTAGGTEAPTIEGQVIPISDLNKGDWVIYDDNQFIWDGEKWARYGSKGDVPKERRINAGDGLTGGGNLATDVTISHESKHDGDQTERFTGLETIDEIQYDKFGHIFGISKIDRTSAVQSLIDPVISDLSDLEGRVDALEGSVVTINNAITVLSDQVDGIEEGLADNYYTKEEVDDAIDSGISSQVPDMIYEVVGDGSQEHPGERVASSEEFEEMLQDVFGPAA